jgi:serine/threonine protein kinase
MDEPVEARGMADLILKLGLADEYTVRECLVELDDPTAPADSLIALMERKGILTPLQGSRLRKGERDGYFLGGYRVLYKISSGTFGRVYRGDDPRSGQVVAIKVLRNKWTQEKQKIDQFMREGRVGLTMRHPNIVQILAVNQDQKTGQYYLVMEFVEGDNLRNILHIRKKLETDEALRMMQECAEGLAYAYSRGLTHRDIKPTNILISTDKTVKLVDFGLAEISQHGPGAIVVDRVHDKDEDVAIDRTLDYAGLEKATNAPKGDVRSDIYFLGHVLYEMLTGEPLMPATRDRHAKMQRRRYEEVETTLARRAPEVGLEPSLQKVIAKAVAFEPHHRFQTPAQFLEAIRAVRAELSGEEEVSRRPAGPLSIYVVEGNQKLQDAFRDRFKKFGFRVLISADATQALKRYQTAPYHALLIDVGTAGQDGVDMFRKVVLEADGMHLDLGAVLILNEEQAPWVADVEGLPGAAVFVRPIGMKQLVQHLREIIPEMAHGDL